MNGTPTATIMTATMHASIVLVHPFIDLTFAIRHPRPSRTLPCTVGTLPIVMRLDDYAEKNKMIFSI
jgi:hypothetical protein